MEKFVLAGRIVKLTVSGGLELDGGEIEVVEKEGLFFTIFFDLQEGVGLGGAEVDLPDEVRRLVGVNVSKGA